MFLTDTAALSGTAAEVIGAVNLDREVTLLPDGIGAQISFDDSTYAALPQALGARFDSNSVTGIVTKFTLPANVSLWAKGSGTLGFIVSR